MPLGKSGEGLESPLQNALGADVDPAARGHLPIHDEALAVEFVKMLPVGPLSNKIGVGDDYARSPDMRGKNGHRFTGLNEEGFFIPKAFELADNGMETLPVARGATDATVNNEI